MVFTLQGVTDNDTTKVELEKNESEDDIYEWVGKRDALAETGVAQFELEGIT